MCWIVEPKVRAISEYSSGQLQCVVDMLSGMVTTNGKQCLKFRVVQDTDRDIQ